MSTSTNFTPYDNNNSGFAVGAKYVPGPRAAIWHEGKINLLHPLTGPPSLAYGINERTVVVGEAYYSAFDSHAFIWTESSGMTDLSPLAADSVAADVNDRDQVVGSSAGHAFIWKDGKLQFIDGLVDDAQGWSFNSAAAINNRGQIVGLGTFDGSIRAFMISPKE